MFSQGFWKSLLHLKGNAAKRFDKLKNSKIRTSQIAIQAWKADTSFAGAMRPMAVTLVFLGGFVVVPVLVFGCRVA